MMCPGSGDDCFTIFAYRERRTESIRRRGHGTRERAAPLLRLTGTPRRAEN
jgi:hypothetical protein